MLNELNVVFAISDTIVSAALLTTKLFLCLMNVRTSDSDHDYNT